MHQKKRHSAVDLSRTGNRFGPHVPGLGANTPPQWVPQLLHAPFVSRFQSDN